MQTAQPKTDYLLGRILKEKLTEQRQKSQEKRR